MLAEFPPFGGGSGGTGIPSAIKLSEPMTLPFGGGRGGTGMPSAINVNFGGGRGGTGIPSAIKLSGPIRLPFGGGSGGTGIPSALRLGVVAGGCCALKQLTLPANGIRIAIAATERRRVGPAL